VAVDVVETIQLISKPYSLLEKAKHTSFFSYIFFRSFL
jgi:hypothetical protein